MKMIRLDNNKLIIYAQTPLKQLPNRVWRTYTGGALIDRWKKVKPELDGNLPEEWIMSAISARGNNRPPEEGLSLIITPSGIISLKELVSLDPELFLGEKTAKKFGTTGILIKMLDSKERLTIQVHPDKKYAREMLNSSFGKTESWYILGGREINVEKSSVYLGFKEGITEEMWYGFFMKQDIKGMLDSLHRFEVNPGDAFIIHGGVPHAIGSGCFLLELQEPTDFTMRVERVTPGGLTISDEMIHNGVGMENMLKCFHYDSCSFEEAKNRWKITPVTVESSDEYTLRSIFNESHTDCFALRELDLNGVMNIKGNGNFFAGVICSGEGIINCGGKEFSFEQGDELFFSAAIENITFRTSVASKILLCYPPE
jgi:mannose-6-phosphate isomerase